MIKDKIIKPFKSMWAYPIALTMKSGGSLRLCINYRKLNAVTKMDAFPLPQLMTHLKIGYWQVKVARTDREKTAFMVLNWLHRFQTMLFVLCNAAVTFQCLMQTALTGSFPKHCTIYLDDILVFGKDMREHNANRKLVLDCLRDAGLTLNPKKCHLLQCSVTFQGHTVSSAGMSVIEDQTKQLRTWPTPANQTELRGFFGSTNYYRCFVKGFAKIASSLHKLIQKQAEKNFKWEDEHDEAFKKLRRMLCFASILALPNFKNNTSLY
ncbi:unnamed protein product [Taenia asiatica]|uniref:Reverse transcriptase domain-containing protein n=1 Tax=Taenia asiatica TaxID=60517 RepID=A0A0R3WD79_TAEAS|nr:unnamed protein product [Taenia asiatica]